MAPKTKDTRVVAKRGTQDLMGLLNGVMEGTRTGRPGAESHLIEAVRLLVQVYLLDEGSLAIAMRALVAGLMDRNDPMRKDIPPEVWSAMWPALNTLMSAQRKATEELQKLKSRREEAHGKREEDEARSEGTPEAAQHAGAGAVGAGARDGAVTSEGGV